MAGSVSGQSDFEARLHRQIAAYHDAALLHAAVTLGLPERLETEPATAGALATERGLSAPHLHRLLRALASLGICAEHSDGTFALTPQGRCLLPGSPARLREKARIVVEQYWRPWAELAAAVETGRPAFENVFGMSVFDWRRAHGEHGALFHAYLAEEMHAQAPAIVAALDLSGVGIVADIGGGYGGLLAKLLQARADLAGILFDRADTIEASLPFLQAQGVADRVRRIGGDLRAAIPVEADLYVLNGVLQQWDDAGACAILANCRQAMPEGARLVIVERLLPENAEDDPAATMLDLHMMAITGGCVRAREHLAKLLARSGLALAHVTPTPSGLAAVAAGPA
jgi:SAM-dependent methyltransferase